MQGSSGPTVRFDALAYDEVAKSFLARLMRNVVGEADRLGLIHLAGDCVLSEDDLSRLYSLAFSFLAVLEDHGGFEQGGAQWFHCTLFATSLPTEAGTFQYLASTARTSLHANLDDEILQAAAHAVCARRPAPTT